MRGWALVLFPAALALAAASLLAAAGPAAAQGDAATVAVDPAEAPSDQGGENVPPQEEAPDEPPPTAAPAPPKPGGGAKSVVPPPPPSDAPSGPQSVVLQGLDKVTARISTIEVPVDGSARLGTLVIVARACQKSPPEEPPEVAAFLEITDMPASTPPVTVFSGWMFASSPALSAMEHPVYDLWVKDCKAFTPDRP